MPQGRILQLPIPPLPPPPHVESWKCCVYKNKLHPVPSAVLQPDINLSLPSEAQGGYTPTGIRKISFQWVVTISRAKPPGFPCTLIPGFSPCPFLYLGTFLPSSQQQQCPTPHSGLFIWKGTMKLISTWIQISLVLPTAQTESPC